MSWLFSLLLGKSDKEILEMKKKKLAEKAKIEKELDEINKFIEEKGIKEE